MSRTLSQRDTILVASIELPEEFTMGDLVDIVWRLFPEQFRLKGYDLPNNAYVESKVYGATGLIYRGLFEQLPGTKTFRVTKAGAREARLLRRQNVLPEDYLPYMPNIVEPYGPPPPPIEKPKPAERVFDPPVPRNPFANHYKLR